MSDHSAKRQRLDSTGRFSPASPPFDVAAKASGTTKTPAHPRTPTSPPRPSMNSHLNGGSAMVSTTGSLDKSAESSLPWSQSFAHSANLASTQHPFPTPASTTGIPSSTNIDSDGDAMMEDGAGEDAARTGDHRLSNHARQHASLYAQDRPPRATEGIFGSQLFKVSKDTVEQSRPHGSQNLFKLYGLEPLASSVARNDPVTGEKINKLRKSYEGHIKALQITGKPKATKMDRVFLEPLMYPADDWHNSQVQGKELAKSLSPDQNTLNLDLGKLLDGALAGMAPGPLPSGDAAKYRAYIGTEETVKPKPQEPSAHRPSPFPSATPVPNSSTAHRGLARPERAGSKRHYTDTSFQGYGEGYGDEYADSTGGEDNGQGNSAKRRRLQFERTSHSVEVGGARR
ncbi:hypothetical protein ACN47E_001326 [Coniothyrium glycines]